MKLKYTAQIAEEDHLIKFMDAVFGTPMADEEFARKCIEHKMHMTKSRREFVRSLYVQAIRSK